MRTILFARLALGIPALVALASASLPSAVAHEAHKMQCTETGINARKADVQSMDEGEAKTTAMKEMQIAEDMMGGKDMKGCEAHMHNAMEAMEK